MLMEVKMFVTSGDRAQKVKHRFTIYLRGETQSVKTRALNQLLLRPSEEKEKSIVLVWNPPGRAKLSHSFPTKPCHLNRFFLPKRVQDLLQEKHFGIV